MVGKDRIELIGNLSGQIIISFWATSLILQLFNIQQLSQPYYTVLSTAGALVIACAIYFLATRIGNNPEKRLMWRQVANVGQIVFAGILASNQMGVYLKEVNPNLYEQPLLQFDKAILGTSVAQALEPLAHPLITDYLQLTYASYFFLPMAVFISLLVAKKHENTELLLATLAMGYCYTLLLYVLVPARSPYIIAELPGPSSLGIVFQGPLPRSGFTEALFNLIHHVEANKRDCFPSGHTGISLVLLVGVWRYKREWIIPYTVISSSLIFSTVYLRYHYLLDLIAGAVWCLFIVAVIPKLYFYQKRWLARRYEVGQRRAT
jgi:membrane-associated phospholipid phosphatase